MDAAADAAARARRSGAARRHAHRNGRRHHGPRCKRAHWSGRHGRWVRGPLRLGDGRRPEHERGQPGERQRVDQCTRRCDGDAVPQRRLQQHGDGRAECERAGRLARTDDGGGARGRVGAVPQLLARHSARRGQADGGRARRELCVRGEHRPQCRAGGGHSYAGGAERQRAARAGARCACVAAGGRSGGVHAVHERTQLPEARRLGALRRHECDGEHERIGAAWAVGSDIRSVGCLHGRRPASARGHPAEQLRSGGDRGERVVANQSGHSGGHGDGERVRRAQGWSGAARVRHRCRAAANSHHCSRSAVRVVWVGRGICGRMSCVHGRGRHVQRQRRVPRAGNERQPASCAGRRQDADPHARRTDLLARIVADPSAVPRHARHDAEGDARRAAAAGCGVCRAAAGRSDEYEHGDVHG
mmetsp:Transcript_40730/g.112024  ORF Transcript_40730/g.112024 Transcript_40730/m.112024 type:complete len:417 (-) Transcript_40730:990-2240(-)